MITGKQSLSAGTAQAHDGYFPVLRVAGGGTGRGAPSDPRSVSGESSERSAASTLAAPTRSGASFLFN